jgi:uncharacterized protein (DUF1697 family)
LHRAGLLDTVSWAGGSNARSYLTTGNVSFDADIGSIDELSSRLETALSEIVSRPTLVAVRKQEWVSRLVSNNPFAGLECGDWELEVTFLRHTSAPLDPRSLPASGRTRLVAIYGREVASARPRSGPGRPHVNTLLERASGEPATARGWTTLCRISRDA